MGQVASSADFGRVWLGDTQAGGYGRDSNTQKLSLNLFAVDIFREPGGFFGRLPRFYRCCMLALFFGLPSSGLGTVPLNRSQLCPISTSLNVV